MQHLSARSRAYLLFAFFLLPFAALAVRHWSWDPPTGSSDYAQYLAHARALVEGRSYKDIGYIYHPGAPMVGPPAYPPGLPLTLAPIVAVAGVDSPLHQALMLLSLLAFAFLAYRRLRETIAPWQAAAAAGLSAFAIEARFGTLAPMSDVGLAALLWATVLAVDREGEWTWQRIVLVTSLGFAALAYRVAGVAVLPALAAYALITWKQNRGRALIPVAVWTAAGVAALRIGAISIPFSQYFTFDDWRDRLANVASEYREAVFEVELYPFPWNAFDDVYHVIASLAVLGGVVALLWRSRRSMLTTTVFMYSALLLASPAIEVRYLWPLYPVVGAGLVMGISAAGRLVTRKQDAVANPLPAVIVVALIMLGGLRQELSAPRPQALESEPETQALYAWLREAQSRTPMRVLTINPRVLTLKTRVPAMTALIVPPAKHVQALREERISHIVLPVGNTSDCRTRVAQLLVSSIPDRFTVEYDNAKWRVYRVLPPSSPDDASEQGPIRPIYRCSRLLDGQATGQR